jgi:hypothetical protein
VPDATFELDTTKFRQAVEFVFENTRKTAPDIINHAALVTIIGGKGVQGAMQLTRRALKSAILAVPVKIIAGVVMKKHKGEFVTRQRTRRGQKAFIVGQAANTRARIKELVQREYRRRIAAIGYTALVGWNNAAIAFGGSGVGKKAVGKGYAAFGYGKPAQGMNLVAEIANTAPAALSIGAQPLQQALNNATQDMIDFWEEKSGEIFEKVTPV